MGQSIPSETSGQIAISDLEKADYDGWFKLWEDNNNGQIDPAITKETWNRLLVAVYPVHGLKAVVDGEIAGLVHYILHPVTGHIHPACYMQDLFVDPKFRRRGVGRALVEYLAAIGKDEGWARMYWLAEDKNEAAQALYKNLGIKLGFSFFVMPL